MRKVFSVIIGLLLSYCGGMVWYHEIGIKIFGIKRYYTEHFYSNVWPSSGVATFSTITSVIISFICGYLIAYFIIFPILIKIREFILNGLHHSKDVIYSTKEIIDSKLNLTSYPVKYYSMAEDEIHNNTMDKNLWSLALVKAKGDEKLRKAEYMKLRAKELFNKFNSK